MDFAELVNKTRANRNVWYPPLDSCVLAFDPGHTTGWAVFRSAKLWHWGEIDTTSIQAATKSVGSLIELHEPETVVMEDYRIYKWRRDHHVGSEMLTTRVIGCIETLCVINGVLNIIKQPASVGKGFCTDTKLKAWFFYQVGAPHANDAIRHGAHFILFGAIEQKQQRKGVTVG